MPALKNQRHEKFALGLFEGKSATEAYITAGYRPCRQNAARLTTKDDIQARLAELQAPAAKEAAVTVESIYSEIDAAIAVAADRRQAAAMVSATSLRAKIAGLMVERVEVGGPNAFDDAETIEDVIEAAGEQLRAEGYRLDEADKAQLTDMLLRQEDERQEFLASCKARAVNIKYANDPTELRHRQTVAAERQRQREQKRIDSKRSLITQ